MKQLSENSLKNLEGVSTYLQMIAKKAITLCDVDFGILNTGGLRTAEMQNEIFKAGHSKCDGYKKQSYHQTGLAVDLVPYINGHYTWNNKEAFIAIYRSFIETEKQLRSVDAIPEGVYFHHGIFWNWKDLDNDGEITCSDKLGWDAAHHEIRGKEQII